MVFFQQRLTHALSVHPSSLGADLKVRMADQLARELEGSMLEGHGLVIAIFTGSIMGMEHGLIDHMTGHVRYTLTFEAILMRLIKNEVVDAEVMEVNQMFMFAAVGPLVVSINDRQIPSDMQYSSEDSSYTSRKTGAKIKAGTHIRLKVLSELQHSRGGGNAIGTIDEPFLGVLH